MTTNRPDYGWTSEERERNERELENAPDPLEDLNRYVVQEFLLERLLEMIKPPGLQL